MNGVAMIFLLLLLVASHIDAKDSVSDGYSSIILALSDKINISLMYLSFTELWIGLCLNNVTTQYSPLKIACVCVFADHCRKSLIVVK